MRKNRAAEPANEIASAISTAPTMEIIKIFLRRTFRAASCLPAYSFKAAFSWSKNRAINSLSSVKASTHLTNRPCLGVFRCIWFIAEAYFKVVWLPTNSNSHLIFHQARKAKCLSSKNQMLTRNAQCMYALISFESTSEGST